MIVVVGYGLSFYLVSISLKVFPIGVAYAIRSGVGIVFSVIAGILLSDETLDSARGEAGILLIPGRNTFDQHLFKICWRTDQPACQYSEVNPAFRKIS